jgi:2-methylisocitrate lyase-like PEP mutase family enzyme
MTRPEQKAAAFRAACGGAVRDSEPWDPGSAHMLEALATKSSGFAFTLGRRDGEATLEQVVEHTAALDRATVLPFSVDLENASPRPLLAGPAADPCRRRGGCQPPPAG